ncbi:MAG: hypothetical protein CMH49_05295 [Myxococcales bacterium]|nr:hypothetical protein [Myxococcales bacterium]
MTKLRCFLSGKMIYIEYVFSILGSDIASLCVGQEEGNYVLLPKEILRSLKQVIPVEGMSLLTFTLYMIP